MIIELDIDVTTMELQPVFASEAVRLWNRPEVALIKAGFPAAVGDLSDQEEGEFVVSCWVMYSARDAADRVYGQAAATTVEENFP